MKEKIVVIFSGGLDSTTLVYYLHNKGFEVCPISFNYGQKHVVELEKAQITCKKLGLIYREVNMKFIKDLLGNSSALTSDNVEVPTLEEVLGTAVPITYVPNRNMIMLSIATSYAEAIGSNKVCFGAQAHDEYSGYFDTNMSFVDAMNNVNKLNREHKIKIIAPFVNLSKSEEIILGNSINIPYEDTISCYKGVNCFTCPTCKDRLMAFAKTGTKDPIQYQVEIDWGELFEKYKRQISLEEVEKKVEWNK